jgi:hypothetical protein
MILLSAALLAGCGKKESKKDYVARVNDSYLTSEDIKGMMGGGSYSKLYRNELIRNWVRREVLYQAALKEGILDEDEYKRLLRDSKKELAASLMLEKHFTEESLNFEPKDIEEFFRKNQETFRLSGDSYLFNIITFNDEDKAVRFRVTAVESDWHKALNVFKGDRSIINENTRILRYEQDIQPAVLVKILQELYSQEICIVLPDGAGNFVVAQLIEKFDKGTIPPFDAIKDKVEDRYIAEKKQELLDSYLKKLYSDNEIEIKDNK